MTKREGDRRETVEEVHFRSQNAFLCARLNRRTKVMRVIDYRSGALPAKRMFIQNLAASEGMQKVVALVEKDEVSAWTKVGFSREGTIPGFYKRSDGHLLGCVFSGNEHVKPAELAKQAERAILAAKKLQKEKGAASAVSTKPVPEKQALAARDEAWKRGPQVGAFDDFAKGATTEYLSVTPKRGGRANYLAAEVEDCFGHAMIEVLRTPGNTQEQDAIRKGLEHFVEQLTDRGVVSAFAFAPIDDIPLAAVFLDAGFRKSGVLAEGRVGQSATLLLTRKLASPDREAAAS